MPSITSTTGSAARWGSAWGARAADWALVEEQQLSTYEPALDAVELTPGQRVLDVGCGTGVFLAAAARRGAEVSGIDASEALLAIARARVPEADLRLGEMESLPWEDGAFDLVTGFNAFFFAADMVAALREAGRVARPDAPVLIQVWGAPDRCDLTALKAVLAPHLPPPPPAPPLWEPGVLEGLAEQAGLAPARAFTTRWAYEFPDEETLARAMLAPGLVAVALRSASEEELRAGILAALAPYRTPGGGYRLENEWRYLIAARARAARTARVRAATS